MEYTNFDLELSGYQKDTTHQETFRVHVVRSDSRNMTSDEAIRVTLTPEQRKRIGQLKERELTKEEMIERGEELGKMLFPPDTQVREHYNWCFRNLKDGQGLRIRLTLGNNALSDLPWEFTYILPPDTPKDQKDPRGFLVLNKRISLVRYPPTEKKMVSLNPVEKLRMVVIMANPKDDPAYGDLGIGDEFGKIEKALEKVPKITPEAFPDATRETVIKALIKPAHIFHFAGHGDFETDLGAAFGTTSGHGYIILLDEERKGDKFPAEKLASDLCGSQVRLAVFTACETGGTDQINAWTGVVPALIREGIPAVVGMQFKIGDQNAIYFSSAFYSALAEGLPIDAAVTNGRLAIHTESKDENERDWGVPVLYLRDEAVLFPTSYVASASKGLGQARGVIAQNPEAFAAVCRSKEAIKISYDQLGELKLLKTIHDALHNIEGLCLDNMVLSGPKYFVTYQEQFESNFDSVKEEVGENTTPFLKDVLKALERVDIAFQFAVAMDDPGKAVLENVVSELKNMLSRLLPRLDDRITEAASKLNLDRLVKLMEEVGSKASKHDLDLPPDFCGVKSLEKLQSSLNSQVEEHYALQDFDSELRKASETTTPTLVVKEWEHIRRLKRDRFRPPFSEKFERSNERLIKIEGIIDAAIECGEYAKALEYLQGYFKLVGAAFFAVDNNLKKHCDDLAKLRPELDSLLQACGG